MRTPKIRRKTYLDFLHTWQDRDLIKVLSGVRRSGKSTLLALFQQDLQAQGVQPQNIIAINFEMMEFEELTDYRKLQDYILSKVDKSQKNYVFLDEIQYVAQFEKVVDSLYVRECIDLYITGSNAFFLSGELATLLTGRYIEQHILPLSFQEFKQWHVENNPQISQLSNPDLYEMYLQSSFPYTLAISNQQESYDYLQAVYASIMFKDVIPRLKTSDVNALERVAKYLASVTGSAISINKIKNTFASSGVKISFETVKRYIQGLQDSLLFYRVAQFKVRGRELLQSSEKYYLVDVGLRRIMLPDANADQGHILENVIYLELLRRGYTVYVGRVDEYEIDFVAVDTMQNLAYYQVALDTLNEDTLARELRPLQKISDSYPKYLLTLDRIGADANYNGIVKMNALDWLLSKENR
ncbi:ATP-binding protein [Acinetobacter sp. WCHAc010052]|jgi:predicted AAA+ superfamily ATPase|uniref:ATP-binding protein n=1 Tax=Acinetobacter sp. WCHAc010052 TaxID=2004647 RepID=UPI000B3C2DD1|nr:ATP-binding protein [Acinetobacter sp. WCHAc010052]AXY59010.1 ATP-binding protein [Acinetobacter sp. WCHAc010052]